MVLKPGESTAVSMEFGMHGNMGGPHDFKLHIKTDDAQQPEKTVDVLSNWVP